MTSLYNFRSVVICLLAFAAFRRFDELPKLVRSDVKIENDMWGSSLLPQMLACQTGFLSVMAAGLVDKNGNVQDSLSSRRLSFSKALGI